MTKDQIEYMTRRFLNWRLPENWKPDGGISFEPFGNKGTPHQYKREPVGTNLLGYEEAEAMIRHMIDGMPGPSDPAQEPEAVGYRYRWKIDGEWTSWRVSDRSQMVEGYLPSLEEIPLYTRPVSLDRLTESNISDEICHVFGCRSTCVSECNSEINKDKCGEAARRVLALIEGRT